MENGESDPMACAGPEEAPLRRRGLAPTARLVRLTAGFPLWVGSFSCDRKAAPLLSSRSLAVHFLHSARSPFGTDGAAIFKCSLSRRRVECKMRRFVFNSCRLRTDSYSLCCEMDLDVLWLKLPANL